MKFLSATCASTLMLSMILSGCGDSAEPKQEDPVFFGEVDMAPDQAAEPMCTTDADCTADEALPYCDQAAGQCAAPPAGGLLGWDGSAGAVTLKTIYAPQVGTISPDLAFHNIRDELWVVNRRPDVEGVCEQTNPSSARCQSLAGFTTIIKNPGKPEQSVQVLEDGNSWHFMRRPPAIAMGRGEFFGTCAEAFTGNFEDDPAMFVGPSLWSSAPDIYAQPSGGNGSHMDMLHATPWCMGMAFEKDNVYWVFNGHVGSLDRYNFHEDHGPGADDHSDGEIYRYAQGQFKRVPNVPSHMIYDAESEMLYVSDTGNGRVAMLDTKSGQRGGFLSPIYEPLANNAMYNNAMVADVVPPGTLTQPSGLALFNGALYIGDHATGKIHAFDLEGKMLRTLDSGLGAGALGGVEVGPDGRLWFVDMKGGGVFRVDRQ